MAPAATRTRGFTLIELVITVTVILVLMLLALPSFEAFRQRAALRASAEQAVAFWNQARLEAAKQNRMVKVGVATSGGKYCLGAALTSEPADDEPCNCFSTSTDICDVAVFPADPANSQSVWRNVTLAATPTLGSGNEVAVIEPKRTGLTDGAMAGAISFAGPPGRRSYRLNMLVDQFGRAVLCESTSAVDGMSDYATRKCAP